MYHPAKSEGEPPHWIEVAANNDSFEWSNAIRTTFPELLDYVTLHDSRLATVVSFTNVPVICIELDAVWNMEYTLSKDRNCDWPYLVVKVPHAVNITYQNVFESTISDAETIVIPKTSLPPLRTHTPTVLLSEAYLLALHQCKELHKTTLLSIHGDAIELLHDSEIYVLLLSPDGDYLDPSFNKGLQRFSDQEEEAPKAPQKHNDLKLDDISPLDKKSIPKSPKKPIAKSFWDILNGK